MNKPVEELRQFDRVEATPLWSAIEARQPGPEVPPPGPNKVRRAVVIVSALALFTVSGAFAWTAFHPSSEPATVGSTNSTALVATLDAPEDGTIPGLTLAYGGTTHDYFAEAGHWPGVKGFNQPGVTFGDSLLPGTSLMIAGDATHVEGNLDWFIEDNQSAAGSPPLSLDLSGGSATLPTAPGRYSLHLTGTWPQGTAEFFVVIKIAPSSSSPTSEPVDSSAPSGGTYQLSNFKVTFPAPTARGSTDPSTAKVDFDSAWSTSYFPGTAKCTIKVLDDAGSPIASQDMSLAHEEPTAHFSAAVPVAHGTPASATGDCGRGMVFVGSSYVFDNLRIAADKVVADVTWSAGTPVGDAACAARIVSPDGAVHIHVGTLGVGEGTNQDVMTMNESYGSDAEVSFRCEPYHSPEQLHNAYWLPWHT